MIRQLLLVTVCVVGVVSPEVVIADPPPPSDGAIRVATYNVAMYRKRAGQLADELRSGESRQAANLAEVIQRIRPDVLLLCEIDYAPDDDPPRLFAQRYLAESQGAGLAGIEYPHRFAAPVNTGDHSGLDLDQDGRTDGPNDAWGYGRYPGQYGMAVLSRFPIDASASRTFRQLLWSDLPDARQPIDPKTGKAHYPETIWKQLRLPSKSLWDVVVRPPKTKPLHLLGSHPTPPVFDGPEDRNGCRNADEIRLLTEYASGQLGDYFVDDRGRAGSLGSGESFVVLGDLNADPADSEDRHGAIDRLLASPRVARFAAPRSKGAVAAAKRGSKLNSEQKGAASEDTANFGQDGVANLRVDYALPSEDLRVLGTGVYWPKPGEPGAKAVTASDHRLVWVDVAISPPAGE